MVHELLCTFGCHGPSSEHECFVFTIIAYGPYDILWSIYYHMNHIIWVALPISSTWTIDNGPLSPNVTLLLDESQMVRSCAVQFLDLNQFYDIQALKLSIFRDSWPLAFGSQLFSNPSHKSKPTLLAGEQIKEKLKLYLSFNKIEESWTPEVND